MIVPQIKFLKILVFLSTERTETVTTTTTKTTRKVAPKIKKPSKYDKTVQVNEHDDLELVVPFTSPSDVQVTWSKDGKALTESRTVQTETTQEVSRLSVKNVSRTDAGTYDVVVQNADGKDKISIGVQVIGK